MLSNFVRLARVSMWGIGIFAAVLAVSPLVSAQSRDAGDERPAAAPELDAETVKKQFDAALAELTDGAFKVREKATQRIKDLGAAVITLIEAKLKDENLAAEARWRLDDALSFLKEKHKTPDERPRAHTVEPEKEWRGGIRIRVFQAGESRSVETTREGTRVSVGTGGKVYIFDKSNDGAFKISVKENDRTENFEFADEAAFKKDKPELHKIYSGGETSIRIMAEPQPAELPRDSGPARENDGRLERELREFQELLEEFERMNNGDPVLPGRGPSGPRQAAEGDLPDDIVRNLSERARERLDRALDSLERRTRDLQNEDNPRVREVNEQNIARDRYLASLEALERSLVDRLARLRKAGKAHEGELDKLQDSIRDTFADLRDKIKDKDKKIWPATLEAGRKFFDRFEADLMVWEEKLADALESVDFLALLDKHQSELLRRVTELYKDAEWARKSLDMMRGNIPLRFDDLRKRLKERGAVVTQAMRKMADAIEAQYGEELDKIAEQLRKRERRKGEDERLPASEAPNVVGGARVESLDDILKAQLKVKQGVAVKAIVNDKGLLSHSGVKANDIVLEVNGVEVADRDSLHKALLALKAGEAFSLKILRDGKAQELKAER